MSQLEGNAGFSGKLATKVTRSRAGRTWLQYWWIRFTDFLKGNT